MTSVILNAGDFQDNLDLGIQARTFLMVDVKSSTGVGTDWTRLLSDPDLVRHVGRLLQAYREAPANKRDEALLAAMREIKAEAAGKVNRSETSARISPAIAVNVPPSVSPIPPFEPNLFRANPGEDRRRFPRIKCFVAVELRVDHADSPIWGNLCNTSVGGCLVETANAVKSGSQVELGLWVANDKIWVKGFALSGIVTRSAPTTGVRVRFAPMEAMERENLRQFLKYVQESTRVSRSENSYLGMLK